MTRRTISQKSLLWTTDLGLWTLVHSLIHLLSYILVRSDYPGFESCNLCCIGYVRSTRVLLMRLRMEGRGRCRIRYRQLSDQVQRVLPLSQRDLRPTS